MLTRNSFQSFFFTDPNCTIDLWLGSLLFFHLPHSQIHSYCHFLLVETIWSFCSLNSPIYTTKTLCIKQNFNILTTQLEIWGVSQMHSLDMEAMEEPAVWSMFFLFQMHSRLHVGSHTAHSGSAQHILDLYCILQNKPVWLMLKWIFLLHETWAHQHASTWVS